MAIESNDDDREQPLCCRVNAIISHLANDRVRILWPCHVSSFLFINFFISALHNVPFSSWTAAERGQSDWPFNGPESVVIVLPINNRLYGPQVFYEPAQKLLREGPAEDEEQSNRIR